MKSEFESKHLDLLAELDRAEQDLDTRYDHYTHCIDEQTCQILSEQIDKLQIHIKRIKKEIV